MNVRIQGEDRRGLLSDREYGRKEGEEQSKIKVLCVGIRLLHDLANNFTSLMQLLSHLTLIVARKCTAIELKFLL